MVGMVIFARMREHKRGFETAKYFDQVWAREVYTGGCPVGLTPPGVLTEYGPALRAPMGRIH